MNDGRARSGGDDEDLGDAEAIAASLTDPARFGLLFDRHGVDIARYLERRLGREAAADLVGEVFCLAFEGRHRFRSDAGTARPWLYGIATNRVRRHWRTELRRLRAMDRIAGAAGCDSRPDDETRVDERLDAAARLPLVLEAIALLDARDRDVVLLVAWEDLTYEEVAEALAIPVGTVRSRLNRARRRIREQLPADGTPDVELPLGRTEMT